MDYSLQYIRNQSSIFIISGCVSGIHDRWIEVVFFKTHCCLMNMNKSPSPAPDIVIISLPMILENNGIAALMENQSPYISMYLIFFFIVAPISSFNFFWRIQHSSAVYTQSLIHILPMRSKRLFRFSLFYVLLLLIQIILWL